MSKRVKDISACYKWINNSAVGLIDILKIDLEIDCLKYLQSLIIVETIRRVAI